MHHRVEYLYDLQSRKALQRDLNYTKDIAGLSNDLQANLLFIFNEIDACNSAFGFPDPLQTHHIRCCIWLLPLLIHPS